MAYSQAYDYDYCPTTTNDNFNLQKPPAVFDGYILPPLPSPPAYIPLAGRLLPANNQSRHNYADSS